MKYYEKDKLKAVPVQEAVGKVLLHDITRIVPDIFKGPSLKKGHLIKKEDIEELLNIGKENIYVACLDGEIHGTIGGRLVEAIVMDACIGSISWPL